MASYCKYYKQQKYVSLDSGETWQALDEYQPGGLYERNSPDCPSTELFYRWYPVANGYICDGKDLYRKVVYQYSSDGVNYINVYPTTFKPTGQPIEVNSEYCNNKFEGHYEIEEVSSHSGCPSGYVWDERLGGCRQKCSAGFKWEPSTHRCEWVDPIKIVKCQSNSDTLTSADTKYYVSGYSVKIEGNYTYTYQYMLNYATIGDCVTTIGDYAFSGCKFLTRLNSDVDGVFNIPSGVTTIGNRAFNGCYSIPTIDIPDNVTSLGDGAFAHCSGLTDVTIGSGVTSINQITFYKCSGLTNVDIPNTITSIGNDAFEYCTSLSSINIPDSVTTIEEWAFARCSGLTNVTIGSGLTSISGNAFYECSGLTSIDIPDNVATIGQMAFEYCTSLSSVTIGSGITTINGAAFRNCSGLTGITINAVTPPSLVARNNSAFDNTNNCPIYVPCDSVSAYTSDTYWHEYRDRIRGMRPCSHYKFDATYSDTTTYLIACNSSSTLSSGETKGHTTSFVDMTRANIGDCVTTIGEGAFSYCFSLTDIDIPSGVTTIGTSAFSYCTGATSATIGGGVTTIGVSAFEECSGLTSIIIPNSVTSLGNAAFWGCSGLTSVTIPSGITTINQATFADCSSLTSITIPSGVTTINGAAFANCVSLSSFTIPSCITVISDNVFENCSGLTSITIPSGVTSIGYSAFWGCSGLSTITIPSGVTSIGNYAFYGCSGLTSIIINATTPPSLSTATDAFDNTNDCPIYVPCDSVSAYKSAYRWSEYADRIYGIPPCLSKKLEAAYLDSSIYRVNCNSSSMLGIGEVRSPYYSYTAMTLAIIGDCVTSIGSQAFMGCSSLSSATIPNSVTTIGDSAFTECIKLKTIEIPNSVTEIGYRAFRYCSGLTSANISDSVTTISGQSFQHCTGLLTVSIGSGVTSILNSAFDDCSSLRNITINATTPPSLGTGALSSTNNCAIYVPEDSVDTYKAASGWSTYSSRIQAIT